MNRIIMAVENVMIINSDSHWNFWVVYITVADRIDSSIIFMARGRGDFVESMDMVLIVISVFIFSFCVRFTGPVFFRES